MDGIVCNPSERQMRLGPEYIVSLCYDEAWLYCATLTYDNKYNWRMPTRTEWMLIPSAVYSWYEDRQIINIRYRKVTPVRD